MKDPSLARAAVSQRGNEYQGVLAPAGCFEQVTIPNGGANYELDHDINRWLEAHLPHGRAKGAFLIPVSTSRCPAESPTGAKF